MAITAEMRTQVSQLYVALFGRAPDSEGLGYWVNELGAGKSLTTVANTMFATSPARAYFPSWMTNGEIVGSFYTNVLGRTADAEGLAFWTAKMNAAGATPGSVISEMIYNVANYDGTDAAGLTSKALYNNKVSVAQYYGEKNGTAAGATTALTGVTSDAATVNTAKASIDSGAGAAAQTFTLTTGADAIAGTAGNDTITGGVGTLTSSDEINGGAGNDTLTVKIDNLTANNTAYAPIINSVETITLEARNASATFFMTNVSGASTVNVKGITNFAVSDLANSGSVNVIGGYSANLTLDIATHTATAQAFTVSFNDASGTDIILADDTGTADTLTLNAVTNWGHGTSLSFSGTEKLTLNGDGNIALNLVSGAGVEATGINDLTAIDASGMTGALTVTLDSKDINLKGGAGNDTFHLTADLSTNDTIDGGAGADTLNATLTGGYVRPILSNVETLNIQTTGTAVTADFRDVSGVTTLNVLQTTGLVLDKLGTAVSTLSVNSGDSTANALTYQYGTAAVASDVTLNLGNAAQGNQQSAAATASGMGVGVITFSGNSGSLTVITNSTAKYTANALELKDFGTVTLNAASANFVVESAVDLYTAQNLTLVAAAGRTLSIGDDLSGDSVRNFTVNAGQSATITLSETANIDGSAGTVALTVGASGLLNFSAVTFCGADTISLNVGASGMITADSITLGQEGATAGSGAVAASAITLAGAGDVAIAALVGQSATTAVSLTFNIAPTSTAADVGISGIVLTDVASAATASEQDVTFNLSGTGNITLSAGTTDSSNVTYRVNATALASGSNLVINLAGVDDTGSVASAVFGAASGSYVGVDGVDNIDLGLGAMTVNGGLGSDTITLGNTANSIVEVSVNGTAQGTDTVRYAAAGDVVLFSGANTATANTYLTAAWATGTATTTAQIRTAAFSAMASAAGLTAVQQLAIYTSNGDTIVEVLAGTAGVTGVISGGAVSGGGDYVQVVLSNKDFTAITAAFQLNSNGSGLSITLL